jgi:hypothetical protein
MRMLFAAAGLVLLATVAPAFAGDQDFTLVNKTGYDVAEVYVSAHSASAWGKDLMGDKVLGDGESLDVSFAHDASACHWDLKVIYTDKDEAEWGNVNLCELSKITIHWDKKSGETTATSD